MSRAIVFCLAFALPAFAQSPTAPPPPAAGEDPDTTRARERFKLGQDKFTAGDYAGALKEFEVARMIKALPELDYNIGVCHEHLGQYREAIGALSAYMASTVDPAIITETRAKIAALEQKVAAANAPPAPQTIVLVAPAAPPPPSYALPASMGVAALAIAAVGVALVAPVPHEYNDLSAAWDQAPSPSLSAAADYLKTRLEVGYALFAVAGAVAIIDVILWARASRRVEQPAPTRTLLPPFPPARSTLFNF